MDNLDNQNVMFNSTNVTDPEQMAITALISPDTKSVEEYVAAAQEATCDELVNDQPSTVDASQTVAVTPDTASIADVADVTGSASCDMAFSLVEPSTVALNAAAIEEEVKRRVAEELKARDLREKELRQFQAQLEDYVRDRPTLAEFLGRVKNESQPFVDFAGKNVSVCLSGSKVGTSVKAASTEPVSVGGVTVEVLVQTIRDCIQKWNENHPKNRVLMIGNDVLAAALNTTTIALLPVLNEGVRTGVIFAEGERRGRKYFVDKKVLGQ